jgi:hypothetical protein
MSVSNKLFQRDLVGILVDDVLIEEHPVLIISSETSNCLEDGQIHGKGRRYIGVMMTSSPKTKNKFSFDLDNEMFEGNLNKENCHFRTHIVVSFYHTQVSQWKNRMKKIHFTALIDEIKDNIFNVD